ncbi:dTMP kinase [Alkaliphilus hydrothermalis]|uniref:Thymidylate kinase n=1 Tax=Alkaliphilus hydrothermalis TaxID=1482730 RepID=A0ABS2NP78_9FIRM|nr:dTMP kinase [Alkaliphilus hydrothermalis]MBM7614737.1 dTMP kinase [Alkaliphilus hydrothermalis]
MMKGLFISIEGMDGAGKTTQVDLMKTFLEKKGYQVLVTREPGGTVIGEKIRKVTLDPAHQEMSYITEALLYSASRAQLVNQVIKPALERGEIVICDRFVDSSLVYQGKARGLGYKAVKEINDFATQGLEPCLTIMFNIAPEVSLKRINARGKEDRLEQEKLAFHQQVHAAYQDLVKLYPQRIKEIDAGRPIEVIQQEIEGILIKLIQEGEYK